MTISIIIPTYNRATLIPRAVNSVIHQTHGDWELVIVDDGSTDNTMSVVKPFLEDKRIIYHKKPNSGAAHTRNVGVDHATGSWVTFLDSDDEADPTWLEKMLHVAEKENASVVCCGVTTYNKLGEVTGQGLPNNMGPLFSNKVARFTNGGVFLLKKEVFVNIGGFDPQLRSGQHTELALRLIPYLNEHRLPLANVFEYLIKVHVHEGPRIRDNYEAIYLGSTYTLMKHRQLFSKYRKNHFVYLSIAAIAAMRTKRYKASSKYFFEALKNRPFKPLSWGRFLLSFVPGLRDFVWRR
jgi:glycosyltransferase involved in cell wall biosynthesis